MWIIIVLILILSISSFWFGRKKDIPPWMKCKESLFEQVVLNKCTPSSFNTPNFEDYPPESEELPIEYPEN